MARATAFNAERLDPVCVISSIRQQVCEEPVWASGRQCPTNWQSADINVVMYFGRNCKWSALRVELEATVECLTGYLLIKPPHRLEQPKPDPPRKSNPSECSGSAGSKINKINPTCEANFRG
jgi:hypothetical protein